MPLAVPMYHSFCVRIDSAWRRFAGFFPSIAGEMAASQPRPQREIQTSGPPCVSSSASLFSGVLRVEELEDSSSGAQPFGVRAGAGQWRNSRPSIGDEDRLRRLIWCAMPKLCSQGRQSAHQIARFGLGLQRSGATLFRLNNQHPNHYPSHAGLARRRFGRPLRTLEAAGARPKRVQHAQQDDYRRLPSGRDPGGRNTG
jgi:hypothetical protein